MGTIPKHQCKGKCAITAKPDQYILNKLETEYKAFEESGSKSVLKRYLTRSIFDKLKLRKTKYGATLYDCIQSGLNEDQYIGIFAADEDSYKVFADIFDPIIEDTHCISKIKRQPDTYFGDINSLKNVDPQKKFVILIRMRCIRNIDQYPFNQLLTEKQYLDLEKNIAKALTNIGKDEFKGTYYPLERLENEVKSKLVEQKILFEENVKELNSAQAYRFWPKGRGIFYNEDKSFFVWVNEKDHTRFITREKNGDFRKVYERLITALREVGKTLFFSRDERLGFLTYSPINIGTTLKVTVSIKIPKSVKENVKLNAIIANYKLELHGPNQDTTAGNVWYNVNNKQLVDLTEYEVVENMQNAILEIIKLEKSL